MKRGENEGKLVRAEAVLSIKHRRNINIGKMYEIITKVKFKQLKPKKSTKGW